MAIIKMNFFSRIFVVALTLIFVAGCSKTVELKISNIEKSPKIQDTGNNQNIQVFSSQNSDMQITINSIEDVFNAMGLRVVGNYEMNKPFEIRYGKVNQKIYNLVSFMNEDLTYKLIKKYPDFGALSPLGMSIWVDEKNAINVSTLSLKGMSQAANVPLDDIDLNAYDAMLRKAMLRAMPNGLFTKLESPCDSKKSVRLKKFIVKSDLNIEEIEAQFEAELEKLDFLVPNYINMQEMIFDKYDYHIYDFYHIYSIYKIESIYQISKKYPQRGIFTPISFYLYKKKSEKSVNMGFLSVDASIYCADVRDKKLLMSLEEIQGALENIVTQIIE